MWQIAKLYAFMLIAAFSLMLGVSAESKPPLPQTIDILIDTEFVHSTLSPNEQRAELNWFHNAGSPYAGMTIHVVSEDIPTHRYESDVLAKAFYDLTGIHVIHEITKEDDVVRKLQVQMELGTHIYDAYVNDTDFIGTHSRYKKTLPISTMINTQWRDITLPSLDLADFIGLDFAKGVDGTLYQLPTQQFANLYWYRHDWFTDPSLKRRFKQYFGYELGVPQNWAAYEDIAHFFTNIVEKIDGQRVWGHMDYGFFEPSLGWRISDSWLSLAGANDRQYQADNDYAEYHGVSDWGIRVKGCHPVGASVSRGGSLDSPAAVYAVNSYINWLYEYAPPNAVNQTFSSSTESLSTGNIAQQIFWYTAFIPKVLTEALLDDDGLPVWRVAPTPRGKYWQVGMKSGYQDISGWTFMTSTPPKNSEAAWLYAQFVVSKTVSMAKFLHGFTPIRQSDLQSDYLLKNAHRWGGLLEFYNSDARNHWSPTGLSVPDYAALSSAWWQHIGPLVGGRVDASEAMSQLAADMDERLETIGQNTNITCQPILNRKTPNEHWLNQTGAPWPEQKQQPQPVTLTYQEALSIWRD
ncbi:ABC transporter substrate-binding protein [Neiella marina]|uniref:ABC transporter substrate-binding protein n=1 Tax=Neiella holothuriorum TaxID=2870530 RepID=A0ABS7EH85_9GAMM|nr:ABC transporter substrate-binding protein [Neiella holothuriorum]MBW8191570.1 ABC transporter substrate-binding protein [Neiella holothuriorum]